MRHTLTALVSAASICAFAFPVAASANVGNGNDIKAQTRQARHHPRMVHHVPRRPANTNPAAAGVTSYQTAAAPGYAYGGPFWPLGAVVEAPVYAASTLATAPFHTAGVAPAPYSGSAPTVPSATGAPLYSYHHTRPIPAAVGSCEIIAGNRVCNGAPAWGYGPNYGYAAGGPIGAAITAPFNAAATVAAAPVAATGAVAAAPTIPSATGAPAYSYSPAAQAPMPAVGGECQILAGNHVCTANYGYAPGGPIEAAIAAPFNAAATVAAAPVAATTP